MPTADRLQEEHDEDARLICAQAGIIRDLDARLRAVEQAQTGIVAVSSQSLKWFAILITLGNLLVAVANWMKK